MGDGENMKSGLWPVVIHSLYVVEALRYLLCLLLRACRNIMQPALSKGNGRCTILYEGWDFNSDNYLFTTDTK